jgi:hypothetical protein
VNRQNEKRKEKNVREKMKKEEKRKKKRDISSKRRLKAETIAEKEINIISKLRSSLTKSFK